MTQPIGHTSPDKTVWWRVDLGRVYNIYSINVFFRSRDGYGTCIYFCTLRMIRTTLVSTRSQENAFLSLNSIRFCGKICDKLFHVQNLVNEALINKLHGRIYANRLRGVLSFFILLLGC